MTNKPHDPVNSPKGYNSHPSGIETVEVTEHLSAMLGSAVKYVWRRELKGAEIQDLEKAAWCFRREATRLLSYTGASAWDGGYWRAPALIARLSDHTVLGQVLGALLSMSAPNDVRAITVMEKFCNDEVARLRAEVP
jgi:hypothetical protein